VAASPEATKPEHHDPVRLREGAQSADRCSSECNPGQRKTPGEPGAHPIASDGANDGGANGDASDDDANDGASVRWQPSVQRPTAPRPR